MTEDPRHDHPGETMQEIFESIGGVPLTEVEREEIFRRAKPLPPASEMDLGLTDEESRRFWEVLDDL